MKRCVEHQRQPATSLDSSESHPARSLLLKVKRAYPRAEVTLVTTPTTGPHTRRTEEVKTRIMMTCRRLQKEEGMVVAHTSVKCTHPNYKVDKLHPRSPECELVKLICQLVPKQD